MCRAFCLFLPSHRTTISSAAAATTAGTLYLELSSRPSDYSYFKSDIMSTWAGPQHWKLRSRFSKGTAPFDDHRYRHHLNNTSRNGISIFRVLAKKSFVSEVKKKTTVLKDHNITNF